MKLSKQAKAKRRQKLNRKRHNYMKKTLHARIGYPLPTRKPVRNRIQMTDAEIAELKKIVLGGNDA